MNDLRTAAQQALAYIEEVDYGPYDERPIVNALKAALAEPVQEQEGPIAEGWQITVAHGHSGYGVYAHMDDYPEEGAVLVLQIAQSERERIKQANAPEIEKVNAHIEMLESDPSSHFCHRFAILMECMLLTDDVSLDRYWDEAHALLDEYNSARDKWMHAQGQPYVSGFGKD